MDKQRYAELHTIEWDILNSACRDCYLNNLECLHYIGECRVNDRKLMEEWDQ